MWDGRSWTSQEKGRGRVRGEYIDPGREIQVEETGLDSIGYSGMGG